MHCHPGYYATLVGLWSRWHDQLWVRAAGFQQPRGMRGLVLSLGLRKHSLQCLHPFVQYVIYNIYLIMYMMYMKYICVYVIYVIVIHTYSYKIEFDYYLLLCASHISPSYLDFRRKWCYSWSIYLFWFWLWHHFCKRLRRQRAAALDFPLVLIWLQKTLCWRRLVILSGSWLVWQQPLLFSCKNGN